MCILNNIYYLYCIRIYINGEITLIDVDVMDEEYAYNYMTLVSDCEGLNLCANLI